MRKQDRPTHDTICCLQNSRASRVERARRAIDSRRSSRASRVAQGGHSGTSAVRPVREPATIELSRAKSSAIARSSPSGRREPVEPHGAPVRSRSPAQSERYFSTAASMRSVPARTAPARRARHHCERREHAIPARSARAHPRSNARRPRLPETWLDQEARDHRDTSPTPCERVDRLPVCSAGVV